MLKVTYYRRRNCRVIIEGHAGSGEAGHDLVCASASILAYTLAANVESMKATKHVGRVAIRLRPGDTVIRCRAKKAYDSVTKIVFNSVCAGFELLSRQYPEFISFEIIE